MPDAHHFCVCMMYAGAVYFPCPDPAKVTFFPCAFCLKRNYVTANHL